VANKDAALRFISLTDGKQPMQTWLTLPLLRLIDDPLVAGRTLSGVAGFLLLLIGIFTASSFLKIKNLVPTFPILHAFYYLEKIQPTSYLRQIYLLKLRLVLNELPKTLTDFSLILKRE